MTDDAMIEALVWAIDMSLTHAVERDTLACDLTPAELRVVARAAAAVLSEAMAEREREIAEMRALCRNAVQIEAARSPESDDVQKAVGTALRRIDAIASGQWKEPS